MLTELGLLPGALLRNAGLKYICRTVELRVGKAGAAFGGGYSEGQTIRIPIAHHDGNYHADAATLDRIEGEGQVAFRYVDTPNGSARDIAGVASATGRVLGMMPHPERAADAGHGGTDGAAFFRGLVESLVSA